MNVEIRNCESFQGHGGVVFGSETSGGIRNIYVHDCEFNGTDRGLRIKTARGRGDAIENVWFEDIQMGSMIKEAIKIHMPRYTDRYPAHPITRMTPRIRNIHYKNIRCEAAGEHAIRIQGLPEMPIESIIMDGIHVKSKQRILMIDAAAILMKNIDVETEDDAILHFDNCSNIIIENMAGSSKKIVVKGQGSKDIRLVNSKLDKEKIVYEDCQNEVSFLISDR